MIPTTPVNMAMSAIVAAAGLAASAHGQFLYTEDFETHGTIGSLEAAGWTFRNQSEAPIRLGWDINGVSGAVGNISIEGSSWAGDGQISTWAIMPPIEGMTPGVPMTVHIAGYFVTPPRYDAMELRYSPTGGTGTGSSAGDVGDFTEVVWSATSEQAGGFWRRHEIPLPGDGRLAWRYTRVGPDVSGRMGIDGIEIGDSAPVLMPRPGETVTWTTAMSPILIESDMVIPRGGTVMVEPGVTIQFASQKVLTVAGRLASASPGPERMSLSGSYTSGLRVGSTGEVDLHFADVNCAMYTTDGSYIKLTDSVIQPGAGEFGGGRTGVTHLVRTEVQKDRFEPWANVVLDDVTFTGSSIHLVNYVVHRGLKSLGGTIEQIVNYQDAFIDEVEVTGAPGAAFRLRPGSWGAGDALFSASNIIENNGYPVELAGAGLHPESVLPLTGNDNDAVLLTSGGGGLRYNRNTWPNLGLDYHARDQVFIQGKLDIAPGLTFKSGPFGELRFVSTQSEYYVRGTPEEPLLFEPLTPGGSWRAIVIEKGLNNIFEHVRITGADRAIVALDGIVEIAECTFVDNTVGIRPSLGYFFVQGTQFLDNEVGAEEDDSIIFEGLNLVGRDRPNIFEGNTLAVQEDVAGGGVIPASGNWWGASDGPSGYYSGSGDPLDGKADPFPFLRARPDLSDTPPVVRLITRPYRYGVAGEKLLLEWTARDDDGIVSQSVQYTDTHGKVQTLVADLPPDQRSIEVTLPAGVIQMRIEATDTAGQRSYEPWEFTSPLEAPAGTVRFRTPVSQGFTGGQDQTICYDALGTELGVHIFLELSAEERWVRGPGGRPGTGECSFSALRFPYISTDRARLAIDGSGENNREWYFSEPFEIRPDPRIGDAPPTVEMLTPADGASFAGGSVVPISWTADDDEGVREFRIQYSTNGGYTWHTLRHRLPGELRSYDWRLPESEGIEDLRVRVVASDLRFQSSTDGDDHVLSVTPGCRVDLDGSGAVDFFDFLEFQNLFGAGDLRADFTGDGVLDFFDFLAFQNEFAAGCL